MRKLRVRLCCTAILLLSACNQVFGLDATRPGDAAEPPAQILRLRFAYQVAETSATGNPLEVPSLIPIPILTVRFGSIDGPLEPATYDPETGEVALPLEALGAEWRLEYAIGSGIPREIHWSTPLDGIPQITEPVFGRLDRVAVPSGSGYTIDTFGSGNNPPYLFPRVLTTGVWTITALGDSSNAPVSLPFDSVKPVSGALGQPQSSLGDRGVFVAYNVNATCNYARGTARFDPPVLQEAMLTPVTAAWSSQLNSGIVFDYSGAGADDSRLSTALGDRAGAKSNRVHLGFAPHAGMPLLSDDDLQVGFPSPPFLSLVDCVLGTTDPTTFADLPLFGFPRLAYAHFEETRTVNGLALTSAVATVSITPNNLFALDLKIPIATGPIQLTHGGGTLDLSGPTDGLVLPRGSPSLRLTFGLEVLVGGGVHSLGVDLYKLDAGSLQHVRTYLIANASKRELVLDPSSLSAGEFVFAISARRGTPRAAAGDFVTVTYPQAVSKVFTRTFVVPP
ncbi:MAG: hypothetical protein WKG01_04885 [Kofleriaceae bacterium]